MHLPRLAEPKRTKRTVKVFAGYDHTDACAEGWFYEEENLSSRSWPALRPRLPRTKVQQLTKPHGLYAKNGLLWVDGTRLFYNGLDMGQVADSDKQFCGMGSKVLIWPDKLCFDTVDQSLKPLGAKWQADGNVTTSPVLEDGREYTISYTGSVPPEKPGNGEYWMDTSSGGAVLRVYSEASGSWGAVPTTYVKLAAKGIGSAFAKYDTVHISGFASADVGELAESLNTDCILWDQGEDYVTVTGLTNKVAVQTPQSGTVILERRVPDLDYLTQQDNRIWGCCSVDHTIYACKQGDPTNWFNYMGTAADSYAVTVGSDGDFTGAATCMGYVLLFKAGCIHKVYGTKPSNYQITTVLCSGVQKGAAETLVLAQGALHYLAPEGMVRYDGSLPTAFGSKLGTSRYVKGAAGAVGDKLYFALTSAKENQGLFTWDMTRGVWHKEDALDVMQFSTDGNTLYALSRDGVLWAMGCEDDPYEDHSGREKQVRWSAETGDIGLYDAENRFVSRLVLRLAGQRGTKLQIFASWDGGSWELLASRILANEHTLLLPILPQRCSRMRLKLVGVGDVRLYSISKVQEQGSEL